MHSIRQRPGFAAYLRGATRAEHERTESSAFVGALLGGRVLQCGYAAYLRQLVEIYAALEDDRTLVMTDPVARQFVDTRLDRRAALHRDLEMLHGPDWAEQLPVAAVTRGYAARVRETAGSWPGGYVAHHYTRYLGDLSGGQALAVAARRRYGLEGTDGTAFYAFDAIPSLKMYKDRYRRFLDKAAWTSEEQSRIADEACAAFRHNYEVLEALGGTGDGGALSRDMVTRPVR
jgi:heme oxygenase (biliverdin-producing, ferredoxin)